MKALEARSLVYRSNKKLKGVKEVDSLIKAAAERGEFSLSTKVLWDWGSVYDLESHYDKLGYKASTSYQQTSPNDSDEYLSLDWSE